MNFSVETLVKVSILTISGGFVEPNRCLLEPYQVAILLKFSCEMKRCNFSSNSSFTIKWAFVMRPSLFSMMFDLVFKWQNLCSDAFLIYLLLVPDYWWLAKAYPEYFFFHDRQIFCSVLISYLMHLVDFLLFSLQERPLFLWLSVCFLVYQTPSN